MQWRTEGRRRRTAPVDPPKMGGIWADEKEKREEKLNYRRPKKEKKRETIIIVCRLS